MPRLTIDNRAVEVDAGATVLAAARKLDIELPTLCYLEPLPACTSCMVCLVKVRGQDGFKPACATPAEEGMAVESETAEIAVPPMIIGGVPGMLMAAIPATTFNR